MTIHLLTDETIGKIAAGEVVERPASVVKELLENAIDAGARHIAVKIAAGGSELIEIVDDGCGMAPADLKLAVQRHATSKLTSFADLDRLASLGFRGEALPSIAAVSDFSIKTRPSASAVGSAIDVHYGEAEPLRQLATASGTRVTVADLFGNVPARRKFLRQQGTEAAYVGRIVAAYAAAYPEIQVALTVDERRAFITDGGSDLIGAAIGAFGAEVGQAALLLQPLDESAAVPGVEVDGWISAPEITRAHRQQMMFFVNGRWVQNRALSFALEEAYHSLIMVGRHPVCVVRIRLDPAAVDVNVHPTKAEVKFVDERAVCRAVQRAAHAALLGVPHDSLPDVRWDAGPAARQQTIMLPPRPPARMDEADESSPDAPPVAAMHPSGIPLLRVLGQVAATYIIAEGPEGMYLIDQHAAHERVMYEKILGQMQAKMVDRQPLLDPLIVELTADELAVVERSAAELAEVGFEIERFGDAAVAVRAVPAIMRRVDITERLRLILRELAEGGAGTSWLDSVAISTACHSSIRAGQQLSMVEMRELVAELERTSQPRACGHGRPTMLHMSQTEMERQFSRR